MLDNLNHISELLCFTIAFILWLKYKRSLFLLFALYLFFITANELIAHYFMSGKNHGIYLLNTLAFVIFNSHVFYKISLISKLNIAIKISAIIYSVFWLVWFSYFGSTSATLQITLSVALHLINLISLIYLYIYLHSFFIHNQEIEKANLWYVSGLVIFCSGMSICFSLLNYFAKHKINFIGLPIHNTLPKLFCVVLYTCTIIALLLWKPKTVK